MCEAGPGPIMRIHGPQDGLLARCGALRRPPGSRFPRTMGYASVGRQRRPATSPWSLVFWCTPHLLNGYPANSSADDRFALATVEAHRLAVSAQWFLSAVGAGYVLVVRWTSRIERQPPPSGGPFIIALWHGQLAMLHQFRFGDHALVALVSDHRDGRLISKCARRFNIRTVSA